MGLQTPSRINTCVRLRYANRTYGPGTYCDVCLNSKDAVARPIGVSPIISCPNED